MNTKHIYIIGFALSMAFAVLLTGCTSDSGEDGHPTRDLYMTLGNQIYTDVTAAVTRALPTGYVVYNNLYPQMAIEDTKIRAYITQGDEMKFQGDFVYEKSGTQTIWKSKVPIDDGEYYVYGFMPSTILNKLKVNLTHPTSDDYSSGAKFEIKDMPAVTPYDPCVIVGVKGNKNGNTSIENINMQLGQFKYSANDDGEYIYVLLDHLYGALEFHMDIDLTYSKLRTIKLTKVEIKPNDNAKTVTMNAQLTQGSTTPLNVNYSVTTTGSVDYQTIFENTTGGEILKVKSQTQSTVDFMTCVAPSTNNKKFLMRSTYDVYDAKNNLIREGCTAVNSIKVPDDKTLQRGQVYIFNLTVNPTYLYVLSDPDLDNPTVVVN